MARKRAEVAPGDEIDLTPVVQQGEAARAASLPREACPYTADGPLREAWLSGFDGED